MRKKNVGAARRPTTLHQRASSTKKYPKCPIATKMIAAVFSQSVSSTGGATLFERVASSTVGGVALSSLSCVKVLRVSVPAGVEPSPWTGHRGGVRAAG